MKTLLASLLSCALLSACAPVETKVTRFHRLPAVGSGQTFTILPHENTGREIETESYNAQIAAHLQKYGWRQGGYKNSEYAVAYRYGISDGHSVTTSVPITGRTGGGSTTHFGTFNSGGSSGSFSGTSYSAPTYGVVGSVPVTRTEFTRTLLIVAKDRNLKPLFETRCYSSGSVGELSQVLPAMIDSAFEDFPGKSGATESYLHPVKK